MLLDDLFLSWNSVCLLLDINVDSWVLNNNWHFLGYGVLLKFPNSELSDVGDFVWHLDLSSVVLPDFSDIWLIDGDGVEGLVPFSLLEFPLNREWLLLVLGHWNLLRGDVWHLLDDGVVNSLGNFVWDFEDFFIRDLVVDGVWDLLSDNIWDLVGDSVWNFPAGGVGDLNFDFIWHLSGDGVWNLLGNFIWLKGLDLVLLSHVVGSCNLVWGGDRLDNWYLLGNLVLLGHVFGDSVVVGIVR